MKILYGVVGEGMGHATRSRVVLEHLRAQGHEVLVVVSNRAFEMLRGHFAGREGPGVVTVKEIAGLSLDDKAKAAEGDAEGRFFAVDAHFQVLFGGVGDAVEGERSQAFFGEAEGGVDEDVGVELGADAGGEDVDGLGERVEEEAGEV